MKLDKYQILNVLNVEKIASDDTGVYDIHFDDLVEKLSINQNEKELIKSLYRNCRLNIEREHLNKISILLDNKIEAFSNDFWELFFFRKHGYSSSYSYRRWDEFNETYESVKIVKKRVRVLKDLNINHEELEIFLKSLTYQQDGYVDLWFSLKKKNKDTSLDEKMKSIIEKYGSIDPNEGQKAIMFSYFKQIKDLEDLYEKNINSVFKREIEEELSKHKVIERKKIELFDDTNYHSVIYRKNVTMNENSLIYDLNKDKKTIEKIVKLIEQFLNQEIYQLKTEYYQEKYTYTIEGYSEDHLKEKESIIKKSFTYLPQLLIKKEYAKLFKEDAYVNEELNQFFKQYIKSAEMYQHLSQKMPEQNNKEKKLKI